MSGFTLRIDGLTAGYGKRRVIDGLALAPVKAGGITALVGPNAAGKSTLLKALAGLVPASGKAVLDGRNLLEQSFRERARQVVFMPQSLPHGVGLTLLETLTSALAIAETDAAPSRRVIEQQSVSVLERLGLLDLAMERLDTLSGGQRQMAALAQALVREPRLLLLDEPTSALDLRHQEVMMQAAQNLAREGRIVIVVLHDLALAARWADRVVVFDRGLVAADAAPQAALTGDVLARVYGVNATVECNSAGRLQIDVTGPLGLTQA